MSVVVTRFYKTKYMSSTSLTSRYFEVRKQGSLPNLALVASSKQLFWSSQSPSTIAMEFSALQWVFKTWHVLPSNGLNLHNRFQSCVHWGSRYRLADLHRRESSARLLMLLVCTCNWPVGWKHHRLSGEYSWINLKSSSTETAQLSLLVTIWEKLTLAFKKLSNSMRFLTQNNLVFQKLFINQHNTLKVKRYRISAGDFTCKRLLCLDNNNNNKIYCKLKI